MLNPGKTLHALVAELTEKYDKLEERKCNEVTPLLLHYSLCFSLMSIEVSLTKNFNYFQSIKNDVRKVLYLTVKNVKSLHNQGSSGESDNECEVKVNRKSTLPNFHFSGFLIFTVKLDSLYHMKKMCVLYNAQA